MMRDLRTAGPLCILVLTTGLAGCKNEPRSVDFFVAHEAEAKKIQESCATGSARGQECENAQTALAMIAANRALEFKPAPARSAGQT